ncbi:MAG: mechanosensitive ion channel family protein [Acidobacteriota bacterium]|nr:mechanosensitive ion channel family protein [Blastocatellia bacterium]MDW8240849.1 mechanosensitive ion channel family protein [Acidobacteriota bacterium]
MLDSLTAWLGFDARYLIVPLAVIVAGVLLRLIIRVYLKEWAAQTETKLDDTIVQLVDQTLLVLLLITALYAVTFLLPLSELILYWTRRVLVVLVLLRVVWLLSQVTSLWLMNLSDRHPEWASHLTPVRHVVKLVWLLIGVALIFKYLRLTITDIGVRFTTIVGIGIGAYVLLKMIRLTVARLEDYVKQRDQLHLSEAQKRAQTLGTIINSVAAVLVIGVAVMMALSELGVDVRPLITGAGIAGLALGFGAQHLVRDIISGFFLILEDQIRIGDVVVINNETSGLVEAIRLRTLVLRDVEGVVHIIPNGEIKQVSNRTKEWSRAVIDVGVAYKEDVDHVMAVLKQVGEEMAADEVFGPLILEPLQILGVNDLANSQVTIRISVKTAPLRQWDVGRELRRRIKRRFDECGIEIPFPHVSVYFGEASKPFRVALRQDADQVGGAPGQS